MLHADMPHPLQNSPLKPLTVRLKVKLGIEVIKLVSEKSDRLGSHCSLLIIIPTITKDYFIIQYYILYLFEHQNAIEHSQEGDFILFVK